MSYESAGHLGASYLTVTKVHENHGCTWTVRSVEHNDEVVDLGTRVDEIWWECVEEVYGLRCLSLWSWKSFFGVSGVSPEGEGTGAVRIVRVLASGQSSSSGITVTQEKRDSTSVFKLSVPESEKDGRKQERVPLFSKGYSARLELNVGKYGAR